MKLFLLLRGLACAFWLSVLLFPPALVGLPAPAAGAARTLLFVDDAPILYRPGTKRVFHPPQRHAANPIIAPDKPWEFTVAYNSVVSDAIDALYDPARSVFVIYAKTWADAPDGQTIWKRAIVRTESRDFVTWSRPELVMMPDEHDGTGVEYRPPQKPMNMTRRGIQFHASPVFYHAGIYFSLLEVMDGETTGAMPIELALSHDGLKWDRPFRRESFIPLSHHPNDFDGGVIWASGTPVILPDEIRFYYGAYRWRWNEGPVEGPSGIGLATLPRDRFARLRPIEKVGQITLRPIEFRPGVKFALNADASIGTIRVELLTTDGHRHPGFTHEEARPIHGDGLRHAVEWEHANTTALPAGSYLIRIHLENAEAFALTIR